MTCFYEYVLPAIGILTHSGQKLKTMEVPIIEDFRKPAGLSVFLKAFFNGQTVSIKQGQESFKLSSFVYSNCFLCLEEEVTEVKAGSMVSIHLLPE